VQLKTHIEALLFLTDKPLKAQAIARTLNQDVQAIRQAMLELINDYESRNGALEIADEDGYMMQVKDEFSSLVDEFAPFEMPTALVRTLSAIALKQPVSQADVIKIRGAGAYDHIKELEIRELIHRREDGRSPILTTTKKFQEYFRLSKDGQGWRQELNTVTKAGKEESGETVSAESQAPVAVQLDVFDASPDSSMQDNRMQDQTVVGAEETRVEDKDFEDKNIEEARLDKLEQVKEANEVATMPAVENESISS